MRLLFFISSMNGGGAERVMTILTSEMNRRGHEVTLVTDCRHSFAYDLDPDIRVSPLWPERPAGNRFIRIVQFYAGVRRIARQVRPDLIISFLPNVCVTVWGLGIPVIQSEHTAINRKLPAKMEFSRRVVNKLAAVVTVLTPTDLLLIQKTLPKAVVMVNPRSFPIYTGAAPREKTILAIGRLFAWKIKGFDFLLEAWGKIAMRYPDWTLQIAGDGTPEDFAQIRSFMQKYRVENSVKLLGFRKDVDRLLQQASLFVLSSRYEGFPMTLIEAMSQGCPCVCFDCDNGPRSILEHEKTGILVSKENSQALGETLAFMIDHPNMREQLSCNALVEAERYAPNMIADHWEALFNQILSK